jgi:acyl-CoA synthetase (AMP-forming)/AMP-acid ligase II
MRNERTRNSGDSDDSVSIAAEIFDLSADRVHLRDQWRRSGFHTGLTLGEAIRAGAARDPDANLVFHSDEHPHVATLAEVYGRAMAVARGLHELGYRAGDVLACQVPNWVEGVITYQAAMHLGLLIVPIVHIYGATEVGFILRASGAKGLVVPSTWRNIDYLDRIRDLRAVTDLEHVIVIGHEIPSGAISWRALEIPGDDVVVAEVSPDDPCLLIYTSGTTAEPKGVVHSHHSLMAELASLTDLMGVGSSSVALAAFPAGHIAGVLNLLRVSTQGTSAVLMDQYDATAAAMLIERHGCTTTSGAPFHLMTLMEAAKRDGRDLSSLRGYMVGAASVAPSLVEAADAFGIRAYRAYGSSEHPVVTTCWPDDPLSKRATTDGRATPGNEIRIVDDDGNDVVKGSDGEIAVRGPEQFIRYQSPEHDRLSFLPGGWFLTGDIGRIDAGGYLTITDRKKDVIIRGGENIASKEVEDLLASHPSVLEAAVIGKPDERYGERVMAFVILREGASLIVDDVKRYFVERGIAKQKTPEFIEVVAELPRGMSGKVKKFELRERARR